MDSTSAPEPLKKKTRLSKKMLPMPPAPLGALVGSGSAADWVALKNCVKRLRLKNKTRAEKFEKFKTNSLELKSANQTVDVSLRLGVSLDIILKEIAKVRDLQIAFLGGAGASLDRSLRHSKLVNNVVSRSVSKCFMGNFLQTGTLLPFKHSLDESIQQFQHVLPSEYLIGVMHFTKLLEHYAVGRAIACDTHSIVICRKIVEAVLEQLLKFDFRNGPLRRNYDGVKYVNKRLQEMEYDLSLVSGKPVSADMKEEETDSTNNATHVDEKFLNEADFDLIRESICKADAARDNVIKQCRDTQKAAKNSIFALHRGPKSLSKAKEMIETAAKNGIQIYRDVMQEYKENRFHGSFPASLEEWAEAALFSHWLEHGHILTFAEMNVQFNQSLSNMDEPTRKASYVELRAHSAVQAAWSSYLEQQPMASYIGRGISKRQVKTALEWLNGVPAGTSMYMVCEVRMLF